MTQMTIYHTYLPKVSCHQSGFLPNLPVLPYKQKFCMGLILVISARFFHPAKLITCIANNLFPIMSVEYTLNFTISKKFYLCNIKRDFQADTMECVNTHQQPVP